MDNIIKSKLTKAMEEKKCRVIVKINPEWCYVPKAYYDWLHGFSRSLIVEYFCKEIIDVIAQDIPAIIIEQGELDESQLAQVKEYAKDRGFLVVCEKMIEQMGQGIKIVSIMRNSEDMYFEDTGEYWRQMKWKYATKMFLKHKM